MAKRLSRARRLAAKQAPIALALKQARSMEHGLEAAKLQQGSPKNTSRAKFDRMSGLGEAPRVRNLDGKGKLKNRKLTLKATPKEHIDWQSDAQYIERLKADFFAKGGHIK